MYTYNATNLVSGRTYNFKVRAVDINGFGALSTAAPFVSCVPPSGMNKPNLESVDETTYTVSWDLPKSDGGCAITGYALWIDDGAGGSIINPVDAVAIANQPYLFKHTTSIAAMKGKTFRIKVEAINIFGSVLSPAL